MTIELSPGFTANGLIEEVRRYLAAVEVFRDEDSEPVWVREQPPRLDWTPVRGAIHRALRPPTKETEV